jgi:hypothetical protein
MELMAEVAQHGWPEWRVAAVRSLRVLRGIVLDGGAKTVVVSARPQTQSAEPDRFAVDVEIAEQAGAGPVSYRATIELADRAPGADPPPAVPTLPSFPMSVRDAYDRWLFHGPLFEGISAIEGMDGEWISALLRPSDPARLVTGARGSWIVDPVLVDSAFQLAILWVRAQHGVTPLPSRLGAYRRFGAPSGAPLRCHLRADATLGGAVLRTQIHFVETDGRVVGALEDMALEDMEFTCSKALNRLGGTAARSSTGR